MSVPTTSREQGEVGRNLLIFGQQLPGFQGRGGEGKRHISVWRQAHVCEMKSIPNLFLGNFSHIFFSSDSEEKQHVKMSCKWKVLGLTSSVIQICDWSCVVVWSHSLLAGKCIKMDFSSPAFCTQRRFPWTSLEALSE